MKEKKLKNWIRLQRKRREASKVVSGITFTPGVPTEDGWYVVRTCTNDYTTMQIRSGKWQDHNPAFILSHAKLPEL